MEDLPRLLRFLVSTPLKITMLQLLGIMIMGMGVLHLISIVSQYFVLSAEDPNFLLYDLIVLTFMNMAGAYIGVNLAVKLGAKFLRYMLLVAILIAAANLLIPQIKLIFS